MADMTFLESIYEGSLDRRLFDAFDVKVDQGKIDALLQRYLKLVAEFPSVEDEGQIPTEMLRRMGEIGLFGASIPSEYGGLGFNVWEHMRMIEGMVEADIAVALVSIAHLSIGVKGIVLFGSREQKRKYLAPAASGEMIFSYALTEPGTGSDAQHIQTSATLSADGSHYLLNGQKTYITNANYAGGMTVFAQMDPRRPGFMGAFIIETSWEGVKIGKDMPKMGLKASSTASVQLRDVRVPVENLIGNPGDGFKIAMTILNYGRLGLGAASVGMMHRSLLDMKKRASSRIQFGVPIIDFPLVQEKLVRARVNGFVNASMNEFAASLLHEEPLKNTAIETSHCKLFGTTRAWDATYDALQVAGGAGYISTLPYEKRMRDFRVTTVFEGTTEIHSIYPALFALRKLGARFAGEKTLTAKVMAAFGMLLRRTEWPLSFPDRTMQRASRLARANAGTIRRLLTLGLLIHGKNIYKKEFLLRRITNLSVYMYGLVSVLARMDRDRREDRLRHEDLNLLESLVEEARRSRRQNRRFFSSRIEVLNGRIMADLVNAGLEKQPGEVRATEPVGA